MISEIYIAPPDNKEYPLHSIEAALSEVKSLHDRGLAAKEITVWCKGGVYPVHRTVVITPQCGIPVTFKAVPGERPVFDGGERLAGFEWCELNGRQVLSAPVPEYLLPGNRVDAFYVNGRAARKASFPKDHKDAYSIAGVFECFNDKFRNASEGFYVKAGDFDADWYNPGGIEALVLQLWTDSHLPVKSYDPATGLVRFTHHSAWKFDVPSVRYCWQNVREALTEPGEFYFDTISRRIYYVPQEGENESNIDAVIPLVPVICLLLGDPAANSFVENISFENLTFCHSGGCRPAVTPFYSCLDNRKFPAEIPNFFAKKFWDNFPEYVTRSSGSPQAAAQLPGTVMMYGAKNCTVSGCEICDADFYAICLAGGCSRIRLDNNHIYGMGAGGMIINGANIHTVPEKHFCATTHVSACNNHIHDCGLLYPGASGFLIGNAWGNLFEHNHIHDLYYSGFSCGWTWGYANASCRENRIGYNLIHDLGKGVLCDMGGIYMLGVQPGTRIYNNHIFNVNCRIYGGWGIYTDEGSSHMVVENNICHDCSWEGYHQHFGRENIVRNNVFACNKLHQLALSKGKEFLECYAFPGENISRQLTVMKNICVSEGQPFFKFMCKEAAVPGQLISDMNCFWDTVAGNAPEIFAAESELFMSEYEWQADYGQWQEAGYDRFSAFFDPGFVSVEKRDFHFKKDSAALKAGFSDTADTLDNAGIIKN